MHTSIGRHHGGKTDGVMREYSPKTFDHLRQLPGFTDAWVQNHLALYREYVDQTNLLAEIMRDWLRVGKTGTIEWAEMKRRFAWEFNGMRLHELYFENLSATSSTLDHRSKIGKKIDEEFGEYGLWEQGFKGTGEIRGAGWVILAFDPESGRLFNIWLSEHDTGLLVGTQPLLVMDVFEHAGFGLNRAEYVEAFFSVIDWDRVDHRLAACVEPQSGCAIA